MKKVSALDLRQSVRKIAAALEREGEPIMLMRGSRPVAVLISLRDFEERFVDKAAAEARQALIAEMDALARPARDATPAVEVIRRARHG